jgi:hypothetical protein
VVLEVALLCFFDFEPEPVDDVVGDEDAAGVPDPCGTTASATANGPP